MNRLFDNFATVGSDSKKTLLVCAALLLVYSIAIYSKSLQNDFVWDTLGVIVEDPTVKHIANSHLLWLPKLWTKPRPFQGQAQNHRRIRYPNAPRNTTS